MINFVIYPTAVPGCSLRDPLSSLQPMATFILRVVEVVKKYVDIEAQEEAEDERKRKKKRPK